jgi:hypothetical protein
MANPYFLGCDLSIPAYTWSAGVNTSYPVANLKTYFVTDVSKANAKTQDQYLLVDLGSALATDTVVIDGHNFGAVGADEGLKWQYNTNDDTVWDDAVTAVSFDNNSLAQSKTYSAVTKRYWRLLFDSSAALTVEPSIGNIFVGTRLQFEKTYEWDYARANKEFATSETQSLNGDIRMSQTFIGRKKWNLSFKLLTDAFKVLYDAFVDVVRGKLRPFYFIDADGSVNYVHFENDYNEMKSFRYNLNDVQIQLKSQRVG